LNLILVAIVALVALSFVVSVSRKDDPQPPPADPTEEAAALESSSGFLRLVDAGRISDSWSLLESSLQQQASPPLWEGLISGLRGAVGPALGRELRSSLYTESLEDAPDGRYFVFDFDTEFQNARMTERVVVVFDRGDWPVSGYWLKQSIPIR
jgi:hypothetical protein